MNMLESYRDIVYGTVVFNILGLPRNQCETFRSISKIENGEILQFWVLCNLTQEKFSGWFGFVLWLSVAMKAEGI